MMDPSRRTFVKAGLAAGASGLAFLSLAERSSALGLGGGRRPAKADYGPLSPKQDLATGLYLLSLPAGFEYLSFGWTGQIMDDGQPTPTDHDGMAVVARHGRAIVLVRNHELIAGEGSQCLVTGGMYNPQEFGGTTTLHFDPLRKRFTNSRTSLGGTIRNCAGGPTPWRSWISCEETFHQWGSRSDGFNHGYIFDVPGLDTSDGVPIRAAGRFSHEAVAVDPMTGVVYETEDNGRGGIWGGFYKYVQPGAGAPGWRRLRARNEPLRDGGLLFAMVVDGVSRKDLRGGFQSGDTFSVSWQHVEDPEGTYGRPFESAPDAAIFSRGEGCWEDGGKIYFVSTDGGAAGLGQVWLYDPDGETITLLYEAADASDVDGPDNIAISPRGGIVLCEDGGSNPKRLIGLTQDGQTFPVAENNIELESGDIDRLESVFPGVKANFWDAVVGDYRGVEWAGATFHGDWLFANVHSPGATFAIRGPWGAGGL